MSRYEICLHYINYLSKYNRTSTFRSLVDSIIKGDMDNEELVSILHMQWLETSEMYESSIEYSTIGIMSPEEYLSKVLQSIRDNKITEILDYETDTGKSG